MRDSLKAYTRRVMGIPKRSPRKWREFLRKYDNKVELFAFFSVQIGNLDIESQIIASYDNEVLCTQSIHNAGLAPCTQEEADTRIFSHVERVTQARERRSNCSPKKKTNGNPPTTGPG